MKKLKRLIIGKGEKTRIGLSQKKGKEIPRRRKIGDANIIWEK